MEAPPPANAASHAAPANATPAQELLAHSQPHLSPDNGTSSGNDGPQSPALGNCRYAEIVSDKPAVQKTKNTPTAEGAELHQVSAEGTRRELSSPAATCGSAEETCNDLSTPGPADHAFSETEVCSNYDPETTEIHTHQIRDIGQVCFIQTDLVSDLATLPVEILQHPVEEGAWLEVSESESQPNVCGEVELMDVGAEAEAHCLEPQTTIEVVSYPLDAQFSGDEGALGSSVELVAEDPAGPEVHSESTVFCHVVCAASEVTPPPVPSDSPRQQVEEEQHAAPSPGSVGSKLLVLNRTDAPPLNHPSFHRSSAQQSSGHQVPQQSSGHQVPQQSSGHQVPQQSSGHQVPQQSSGHQVPQQSSGHQVPQQSSGHQVLQQSSGHQVLQQSSGHQVLQQSSGHQVLQQSSGPAGTPREGSDGEADDAAPRKWAAGKDHVTSSGSMSPAASPGPSTPTDHTPSLRSQARLAPPQSHSWKGESSQPDHTPTPRPRPEKHADMAELAKHEAEIEHRTLALKREGFWSLKRLNRVTEPVRPKVHWDYLCEEMQWLSADFAQERRWKRGVARKVVRMVMRHHEELRQKEERAKREEQSKIRRVASSIAKEVRAFWSNVEKVVQYKQQSRLEEKRKKALDLQLDFIVGQTERYSDLLSQSLSAAPPADSVSPPKHSTRQAGDEEDQDFEPSCEEEDDEETIEVEEQQEGNDDETHRKEIELLRQEGELPLDQLLSTLTCPPEAASEEESSDSASSAVEDEDEEFAADEEDAEDEEDTIAAQEVVEGDADHKEELDDLAKEGEMSVEDLLEKYKGAYSSDFEEPSGSASPDTSEEEDSTEEEEEEEESEGEESGEDSHTTSDSSEALESNEEVEDEEDGGEGMEALLKEGDLGSPLPASPRPKKEISHIAATAESLQPKGYTLATTKVKTPIPFLLHGTLREYQHIGLDWLVTMNEKKLNGILADEMGLGKTIQTIALLAHLACEKGNWGPHLIIVPTSVMLNWEMELKRWCPGFKILTYYGSQKERKLKRQGWTKPNAFHVCITSYKLVLQDHQAFRRKSWRYLILDEAQNIKNFKSQRWQSLLNFNSQRRLLLTGTPLQNSLMELWSLMHFLMPHVFQSHREFKEWFSNPLTGMIEGSQEYNEGLVKRLHKVLRPFLLRRIKVDVEKQMPKKYEHVVRCRLSKRQRFLYDDFMAQASTRETLASGHFMSVINILMQLRKVCNHPNLFDPRPIHSPFITEPVIFSTASLVQQALEHAPFKRCDLSTFDLVGLEGRVSRYQADVFLPRRNVTMPLVQELMESPEAPPRPKPVRMKVNRMFQPPPKPEGRSVLLVNTPVTPAAPPPPAPLVTELPQVCPVTPAPAARLPVYTAAVTVGPGVGGATAHPVLSVRTPVPSSSSTVSSSSGVITQRVLLSPDMQARLPTGEVVSIAQLASLAGRPVSSSQGSKPVTFQLQGNKLTLSGTQLHQTPVSQPRPIQAPTSMVSSPGIVKIVVRQSGAKEGGQVPTLAVPPSPRVAAPQTLSLHPHTNSVPAPRPPQALQRPPVAQAALYAAPSRNPTSAPGHPAPPRPVLRVLPGPAAALEPARVNPPPVARDDGGADVVPVCASTPASKPSGLSFQRPRVQPPPPPRSPFHMSWLAERRKADRDARLAHIARVNELHCGVKPVYGCEVLDFLTFLPGSAPRPAAPVPGRWDHSGHASCLLAQSRHPLNFWARSDFLGAAIWSYEERLQMLSEIIDRFTFAIPPVEARPIAMHSCHPPPSLRHQRALFSSALSSQVSPRSRVLHRIQCNMRTHFPELRLIQYDCGKLQTLHVLLRRLKTGGHRVLIFTQMTRMLDVLEQFLNYHGHIYLRLDGSTRVEQRQALMERFNADRRIFCFILSTRSGGVGVNLTGADTVVFYDSDWNPTMDAQAQDRCHRIGQTRDVHIYRLISERTVEENILKKANQKRMLGDMAIEGGNFTTAFFKQQTIRELFDMTEGEKKETDLPPTQQEEEDTANKQQTNILEQALCRAEDEEDIVAASQAKAEQVAELAEFNESIPLDDVGDGIGRDQEEEELSKAEQEIAALVEQLTPIERYAMNFLEASLEDICKEELKQAEEQVEAARKGLDQAKEEGLLLHQSSDSDQEDFCPTPHTPEEPAQPALVRRTRKIKEKGAPSVRASGRLRGSPAKLDADSDGGVSTSQTPSLRGVRGRGASREPGAAQQASASPTSPPKAGPAPPAAAHPRGEDHRGPAHAADSPPEPTPPPVGRDRGVSVSSGSICSPDHQSDLEGLQPLSPSSRSPRKRQSADGEVLRGLPEDSPSAKVLRKLPGRLVTVVEEKEPKRRRRRVSGGVGSSEETEHPKKADQSPEDRETPAANAAPPQEDKEPPSSPTSPGKFYCPYSPTHPSPDMPVLRNLPVRRRLETESRMAAQLGEQQAGRGRGTPTAAKKPEPTPTPAPVKRKRGRPPKNPSPASRSTSLSPKRKRGRPRKEAAASSSSSPPPPPPCSPLSPPRALSRLSGTGRSARRFPSATSSSSAHRCHAYSARSRNRSWGPSSAGTSSPDDSGAPPG
ncbi:helicase SRCAP isoform X2 [Denticeps clupeoides]|uniref:Helicase SRCAP n=1 Tax=Denticeps clupeoides TaxID=299321 RepID=A0AAY4DH03_9TELE|nr:helicase SRCAP isoform X2 [Denticeps clupeoides]